jgi:DNA polymerase
MDAKARLRAYLEQRRELGESELVLDSLQVDDVLRLLGAGGGVDAANGPGPAPVVSSPGDAPSPMPRAAAPVAAVAPPRPPEPVGDVDWRAALADEKPRGLPPARPVDPVVPVVAPVARVVDAERRVVPPAPPAVPGGDVSAPEPVAARSGVLRITGIEIAEGLRVERPAQALLGTHPEWPDLAAIAEAVQGCTRCPLYQTATHGVPGEGHAQADVMVVGEAPGEQEDLQGRPFVGPAGQLLTKILGSIKLEREEVFIANVLKHRPPGNRNPAPDEVRACAPYLQRQVDLVRPKLILAFGTFAAQTLLNTRIAIGKLRQQVHWYQGIPLVATYHPAALLRNEAWKRPTWEDVKLARRVLDATHRT